MAEVVYRFLEARRFKNRVMYALYRKIVPTHWKEYFGGEVEAQNLGEKGANKC